MLWSLDVAFTCSYLNFFHFQFYCSKDNEYNDLATIFFNTQVFFLFSETLFFHLHGYISMVPLWFQFTGICLCWYRMMP